MTPRCPKGTRKRPCAGEVAEATCHEVGDRYHGPREWCGKTFDRCQAHGGEAGARRSLQSHRGVYHPREKGDER